MLNLLGQTDYKGHGYHHPCEVVETQSGIDTFPSIFSYPSVSFCEI